MDYDYKKKRQGKIPDEEVRQALEKFHESKEVAENSMYNLLETDVRTCLCVQGCYGLFIYLVFVFTFTGTGNGCICFLSDKGVYVYK